MSIISLTKKDFDGNYLKTYINDIVIILFKADWCKFCVEFKPLYEELSKYFNSKIIFTTVDIDKESDLVNNLNINPYGYKIKTYPTIVIYSQGYFLDKYVDNRDKQLLITYLQNIIDLYNIDKKIINNSIIIKTHKKNIKK